MRLIILGNGFDLAHKLPTNFSDFREFMKNHDESFVDKIDEYIIDGTEWNEIETDLENFNSEKFREKNCTYLVDYTSDEWRDSANHDYQYQMDLNSEFIKDLQPNLRYWISSIDVNITPIYNKELFEGDCKFLTFNYTRTLEVVYNISDNILHIHGYEGKDEDELIVGHNNKDRLKPNYGAIPECEIDWRIREGDEKVFNKLESFYKNSAKIIENYKDFFESLVDVSEIYVIGHSMSYIDEIYFQHILKLVPAECVWNITYHGDSAETKMEDYNKKLNSISSIGIKNYNLIKSDDLLKKEVKLCRK